MAPFEYGMDGDQPIRLEDADLVGQAVHLDDAFAGGIGHAVEIAANADHALVRDSPFELKHGAERHQRQGLEKEFLFGEGLVDDAPGRRVRR